MAPYVSVTVDKESGSSYVKMLLPLDAMSCYDDMTFQWVWNDERKEAVDKSTGVTFHERTGLVTRVLLGHDVWDYRYQFNNLAI